MNIKNFNSNGYTLSGYRKWHDLVDGLLIIAVIVLLCLVAKIMYIVDQT